MALPSFLNQTCLFLLHGNAGCAEGTADTAIQGAVSHDSAGSLLADQAVGPSGVKQTATAASVWTAELGTQRYNADGLVFKFFFLLLLLLRTLLL